MKMMMIHYHNLLPQMILMVLVDIIRVWRPLKKSDCPRITFVGAIRMKKIIHQQFSRTDS